MSNFFARNIDWRGRVARALWGLALMGLGLALRRAIGWLCVGLMLAGLFALYEAARGWCLVRACGIKTRL